MKSSLKIPVDTVKGKVIVTVEFPDDAVPGLVLYPSQTFSDGVSKLELVFRMASPVADGVYSLEWLDADTVRLTKPPSG